MLGRLALVALVLSGCGPAVRWRMRSADLAHRVEAIELDGGLALRIDGVVGARFDDVGPAVFDGETAFYVGRDAAGWHVVGPEGPGEAFLDVALPLRVEAERLLSIVARADGWHVSLGGALGPALAAAPTEILVSASGLPVYVGRGPSAERVVVGERAGAPYERVELLSLLGDGETPLYAGRLGDAESIVLGERVTSPLEDVLELVPYRAGYAAIVGVGEGCELVVGDAEGVRERLGAAPLLTHLRASDDGAHVAWLAPTLDGSSIEVFLDGASIATHRRVDGERLAFVPGGGPLFWISEDAQGFVVHVGEAESARYEAVDGPALAHGRVGFVGQRLERADVVIDGVVIAEETRATALVLGEGGHFAYVARNEAGDRVVVTRRGRWPVPRLFVDTLLLGASGEHWAALVPDAAERELTVFVDGEPVASAAAEEIVGPTLALGLDPAAVCRDVVRAVLARRLGGS